MSSAVYYGNTITGVPSSVGLNAEYTSQQVESNFDQLMQTIYGDFIVLQTGSASSTIQPGPGVTTPDQAAYDIGYQLQQFLANTAGGVTDSSGSTWYLTQQMASVINSLQSSFTAAGISITSTSNPIPSSGGAALLGVPSGGGSATGWYYAVTAAGTSTTNAGIFSPVSSTNSTPLIINQAGLAEAANVSLQYMIDVNYISVGNNILSNQLNTLDTQMTQAQAGVGSLNILQDLHNQIQAPNPQNVPTTVLTDTNLFASEASQLWGNALTPYAIATQTNVIDGTTTPWVVASLASTLSVTVAGFYGGTSTGYQSVDNPPVALSGSMTTYNSVITDGTDTLNLQQQQTALGSAITNLENAGVTGTGSLTNTLGTVATDISNYIGGNAYTANATTGALTQSTVSASAPTGFVQTVGKTSAGTQEFFGVPVCYAGQDSASPTNDSLSGSMPANVVGFSDADVSNLVSFSELSPTDQAVMTGEINNATAQSINYTVNNDSPAPPAGFTLTPPVFPSTAPTVNVPAGTPLSSPIFSYLNANGAVPGAPLQNTVYNTAFPGVATSAFQYALVQVNNSADPPTATIVPYSSTLSTSNNYYLVAVAPGFQNTSAYGWIMDGQNATSGAGVSTSGTVQNDITSALTTGQNLNTQLSQKSQQYLYIFQEFYQSASGILTAINQFMQQITQGMGQ